MASFRHCHFSLALAGPCVALASVPRDGEASLRQPGTAIIWQKQGPSELLGVSVTQEVFSADALQSLGAHPWGEVILLLRREGN